MPVSNHVKAKNAFRISQPNIDQQFHDSTIAGVPMTFNPNMEITEGPFAKSDPSDPIGYRQEMARDSDDGGVMLGREHSKEAIVAGGGGGMDAGSVPGMNRALQNPQGPLGGTGPVYGSDVQDQVPYDAARMKVDSAPTQGTNKVVRKLLANVERRSSTDEKGSNLSAPDVPAQPLTPRQRAGAGNIDADDHNRSAWIQSGVGGQPMLDGGQMKLSFVDKEDKENDAVLAAAEEVDGDDDFTDPGPVEPDVEETDPDPENDPDTESDESSDGGLDFEPPPAVAISAKVAMARLSFAAVPLELVENPLSVFVPRHHEKTASDSKDYFARDDVHPMTLDALLDSQIDPEWRTWEPETISESIERTVGVEPSDSTMNKVMALKLVYGCPQRVMDDWHILEKVAIALDGHGPAMNEIEDVDPLQLCHAISIIRKLSSAKPSDEVAKYTAARLYDAGYVISPPQLAFADVHLKKMANDEQLRNKVIQGYADALKGKQPSTDSENPVDIQVMRLLASHEYVLDQLDESVSQLA